jgi:hypothetical protein
VSPESLQVLGQRDPAKDLAHVDTALDDVGATAATPAIVFRGLGPVVNNVEINFFKGCPGWAWERTRDLFISFIFSFDHFTAEPQRFPGNVEIHSLGQFGAPRTQSYDFDLQRRRCKL